MVLKALFINFKTQEDFLGEVDIEVKRKKRIRARKHMLTFDSSKTFC